MRKLILPLLACSALGLCLQGCTKSSDDAERNPDGQSGSSSLQYPEGPVELKIKWPVGRRYVHRMELKQKSVTQLPQRPEPMKQDVTMTQEYAVSVLQEREPAGKELELEYLFAAMDASMNNRSLFSFDSAGESLDSADNPMAAVFRNMVGMRLKLILDEKNQVESVEGLKEFADKMVLNSPPRGRAIITNLFGEETFKQMVEFGRGFPSHAVEPGDTWSSTNEIAMGPTGKLAITLDYTFKRWDTRQDRACALLEFNGALESTDEGGTGPMGMKMRVQDGHMSGTSWLDPELGMIVESQINQTMTMLITATIPRLGDRGGGEQQITTKLNQDINLKLVELSGN